MTELVLIHHASYIETHDFHDFSVHPIECWCSTHSPCSGLSTVAGTVDVNQKGVNQK
jgi:muramidase (phage lysozyme)